MGWKMYCGERTETMREVVQVVVVTRAEVRAGRRGKSDRLIFGGDGGVVVVRELPWRGEVRSG